jgi:hypothetical protein
MLVSVLVVKRRWWSYRRLHNARREMLATREREFYRTARGRWEFVRHLMAKIGAFALMRPVRQKKKAPVSHATGRGFEQF